MVAMILALFGKIDSNGVVAILSGVAGYVLGGIHKEPAEEESSKPSK